MKHTDIRDIFEKSVEFDGKDIVICGWVKSNRSSKNVGFLSVGDGTCYSPVQVVYGTDTEDYDNIEKLLSGAAVICEGKLLLTPDQKQPFELQAKKVTVVGDCDNSYPLQKKRHTFEYLRTISHLRPRANTFQAVFKIRSLAAMAIHEYFQQQGFVYVHTPIITGNDCEGAGEMFSVTTLPKENIPKTPDGKVDYSQDFFGHEVSLTVSGQLYGETFATAFKRIYTFGPTFRAENSNTARHAAEFWMIEPEMAFADLSDDMDYAEGMIKYIINYVCEHAKSELEFLNERIDTGLLERLDSVRSSDFERITYTKAVELLEPHNEEFKYPIEWGKELQTEHERYLTEKIYKKPVFVTDYPMEVKAFYMKQNPDGKTVAAVDCLVPGVGEIIGGSQREDDLDKLVKRMEDLNMDMSGYEYYLDLRRFGSVPHSGFGLGFERIIMYLTGMSNIRDVIPFPRTAGSCEL